jgi:hypothetical protein
MAYLPQELIDYLLEELRDDTESLKACSLASSIFLKTSRKQLFQSLTLNFDKITQFPEGLAFLQLSPPHSTPLYQQLVAHSIRHLTVDFKFADPWDFPSLHLPQLQTLVLRCFSWQHSLDASSRRRTLVGSLSPLHLKLNYARFDSNYELRKLLLAYPLSAISMQGFRIDHDTVQHRTVDASPIRVSQLTFDHYADSSLRALLKVASPEGVYLKKYSWASPELYEALQTIGDNLLHLEIDIDLECGGDHQHTDQNDI